MVRVLVPGLVLFETRQDWTALPDWRNHDRTTCLCPIARENPEKIQEKNGTGWDYSVPLGKVLSSTEFRDFSRKSPKNNTTQKNIQFLLGECPKTVWSFFWLYINYAIITVHFIKKARSWTCTQANDWKQAMVCMHGQWLKGNNKEIYLSMGS